jgi:hypothetical protein
MRDPLRRSYLSIQPLEYEAATDSVVLRETAVGKALRGNEDQIHRGDVIDGVRNGMILSGLIWLILFAVAKYVFNLI